MLNIVLVFIVFVAGGLLFWLGLLTWRGQSKLMTWAVTPLAVLSAAAICFAGVLMVAGLTKMHARGAPAPDLTAASTRQQIRRGEAIANSFCAGCHSPNGTLTGGIDVGKDLPAPIGTFISSNLTPAGQLRHWSDGQIFRAIRNGVDADGRWLVIMSYTNAGKLSDDDIHAVIAYLRSLPAAGAATATAPDQFNLLGLFMLGAGLLPTGKPVFTGVVTAPVKEPTERYGAYIMSYQDCRECHGKDLMGGVQGQMAPIGPGLSLTASWKLSEFIATMRTGIDPSGHQLSKEMPWQPIGKMDDVELEALYRFLTHLPGAQAAQN
ncbi:MAG TPA: cytochrome c [Pseudolabrys sp.]